MFLNPARLLLVCVLAGTSFSGIAKPAAQKELEAKLPTMMKEAGVLGLSLSFIEDGKPVWHGDFGIGKADSESKVERTTVFQAASLSKPVFAYVCFRLVEQGVLDLDKSLAAYLENERMNHDERYKKITARHVLAHRSGLPNWGGDKLDLAFEPGAFFRYSGEGYGYLGQVLEKLTGKTVEQLAKREVFEPLGMKHSSFIWQPAFETSAAWPHDSMLKPQETRRKPEEAIPAASLHTTSEDYGLFLQALFAHKGLKEASWQAMFTSQGNVVKSETDTGEINDVVQWGLGWGLEQVGDQTNFFHWGDNGNFKAFVIGNLKAKKALVYFTNTSEGLAIVKPLASAVFPGEHPSVDWIGYEAYDRPGRREVRQGRKFIDAKDYAAAAKAFGRAAAIAKEDAAIQREWEWSKQLERVHREPVVIPQGKLAAYAGSYGPRELRQDGERLVYQRKGRSSFPLIPLSQNRFALDGLFWFQLEVIVDEAGQAIMLKGHYLDGRTDESPRDSEAS
jgi:CubicO group peptidase (beta-lactamase class C family)